MTASGGQQLARERRRCRAVPGCSRRGAWPRLQDASCSSIVPRLSGVGFGRGWRNSIPKAENGDVLAAEIMHMESHVGLLKSSETGSCHPVRRVRCKLSLIECIDHSARGRVANQCMSGQRSDRAEASRRRRRTPPGGRVGGAGKTPGLFQVVLRKSSDCKESTKEQTIGARK